MLKSIVDVKQGPIYCSLVTRLGTQMSEAENDMVAAHILSAYLLGRSDLKDDLIHILYTKEALEPAWSNALVAHFQRDRKLKT